MRYSAQCLNPSKADRGTNLIAFNVASCSPMILVPGARKSLELHFDLSYGAG